MAARYILETIDFTDSHHVGIRVRDSLQGDKITDHAKISYKAIQEWRIQPNQIQAFIENGLEKGMNLATILDLLNRTAMAGRSDPVEEKFAKLRAEVENGNKS